MEKQNIQYFVLAIREGEKQVHADVFYDLRDDVSITTFENIVENINLRDKEDDDYPEE